MLSRLKSTVKGVVGMVRGAPAPAAHPASPPAAKPAPTPAAAAAPRPAPPKPAEPAPKPAAPVARAADPVAEAAEPTVAPSPAVEAASHGAASNGSAPAEANGAPKKLSLAERAAQAAKAPAPVPSHAAAGGHDDEEHDDDHAPAKKAAAAPVKHTHADTGSTDKAAYILRAKANGRDVSTVIGEEGLNVLEDGTQFWGPVNNSSSRAKAEGKVLTIDQFECISCGTCVEQTEKVFFLPADGKATPIAQDGPMDLIEDAIEACPVTCIHWTTAEEAREKGLATGENLDEASA